MTAVDTKAVENDVVSTAKAPEVLERIVRLFYVAIPKLGNFSEIVSALSEEVARPPPWEKSSLNETYGRMDNSRGTAVTSVSVHSVFSDGSEAFPMLSTSEEGTF